MLLEARDEDGAGFTPAELRDQLMHLLFGGHDTTSSTLSFLFYELARNPAVLARVCWLSRSACWPGAPAERRGPARRPALPLDGRRRDAAAVSAGLVRTAHERQAVRASTGYRIPAGVHVIHSSWVTHQLPEVFPDPEAFVPERFSPEARRALPNGAYIPFGGGQRICIGKRFGQLVVKAVATTVLQRFSFELGAGFELRIAKVPTLSPEGGLPLSSETGPSGPAGRGAGDGGCGSRQLVANQDRGWKATAARGTVREHASSGGRRRSRARERTGERTCRPHRRFFPRRSPRGPLPV